MPLLMVMLGGAIGSGLRFLVTQWLPTAPGALPLSTLLVNVVGSGVLGALTVLIQHHTAMSREVALLLGAGLCGGFTTFSTFTVELVTLYDADRIGIGMVYAALSIVLGLLAAVAGSAVARTFLPPTV